MSKAWTRGTPAAIMVASWRLKMAMSALLIFLFTLNSGSAFFLSLVGLTPWRRSSARTTVRFGARVSPLMRVPRRSMPSQA